MNYSLPFDRLFHRYGKRSLHSLLFPSGRKCVIVGDNKKETPASGGSSMTFDEILAQIIDLLKHQGRVSYRAIKRRFDIDDDYIEDLKEELLYVHPVIDDEGRGLMWTGDTASGQAVVPQPGQPTPPPAAQQQPSPEVTPRVTASPPLDAERRQLTVMFC